MAADSETPQPGNDAPGIVRNRPRANAKSDSVPETRVSVSPTPREALNADDSGDETQRNFRYQHAYGVILLTQAVLGAQPYTSIWCEQHEDFLAERTDGKFDGWQIKTSKPELGPWTLRDGELIGSIGRFCDLEGQYGDKIAGYFFASNAAVDSVGEDVRDQRRRARCPDLFLQAVRLATSLDEIPEPFAETFRELEAATGTSTQLLFSTLNKTRIVLGPGRRDFEATLAHDHIGTLPDCQALSSQEIADLRDDVMRLVGNACSLALIGGRRDVHPISGSEGAAPELLAKRIVVEDFRTMARDFSTGSFRILRRGSLPLGREQTKAGTRLRLKLEHGGLDDAQIEEFETLGRSTEYHLLEEAARKGDQYPRIHEDLQNAVLHEYLQAHLRAKQESEPFGEQLMIALQDRLSNVANNSPKEVWGKPAKCLIGVAALLTDECRMWFSERFVIDDAAAPGTTP